MADYKGPKNNKGPLPPGKSTLKKFEPTQIVYAVFGMTSDRTGNLIFSLTNLEYGDVKPIKPEDIEKQAVKVAKAGYHPPRPAVPPSPWDIKISQQSYMLLLLHPDVPNWAFWDSGVDSKGGFDAYDFDPHWLETGDKVSNTGAIGAKRPKVLYFSVGGRGYKAAHRLDYLIKFFDPAGKWEMPIIFDPDVPNVGDAFPPDP